MFSARLTQLQRELPAQVKLLLVSKGVSIDQMREAFTHGLSDFGESYWQEASPKQAALADCAIDWHFIGRLQSNKCALIAANFSWVQSVAAVHHAIALNQGRLGQTPLNICLQVNVSNEAQKAGLALKDVPSFIEQLRPLSHLHLRGLMLIPKEDCPHSFHSLAHLFQQLKRDLALPDSFDTLSMGMSHDYQAAILAGSTMVRIGSLLFK